MLVLNERNMATKKKRRVCHKSMAHPLFIRNHPHPYGFIFISARVFWEKFLKKLENGEC